MIVAGAIFFSALLLIVSSSSEAQYEVPEPHIEVFSPKGLRISIPDSRNVESVEFFISIPRIRESFTHVANNSDRGYWMYWNPEITIPNHEQIHYRLMVKHLGYYWTKEGVHVVNNGQEEPNNGQWEPNNGQREPNNGQREPNNGQREPNNGQREPNNARPTSGQSQSDPDCQDIQGREIMAAFGNLDEAARHHLGKISCSKQLPHFKSLFLTPNGSDLKPIKKSTTSVTAGTFYMKPTGEIEATGYKTGSSFDSTKNLGEQWQHFKSDLTAEDLENMKKIYNSGFFGFREPSGRFFPDSLTNLGEASRQFHEARESHESSYVRTGNELPSNPSPPHGAILRRREYVREEHTVPGGDGSFVHRINPHGSSVSGQASFRTQEFKPEETGILQTIENRSRSYSGDIFTSYTSAKPNYPQECVLIPGGDYSPTGNVAEVEKFAHELSCLASVAESSVKKEINSINQKNVELERKVEWLEHEMKRLASSCSCY